MKTTIKSAAIGLLTLLAVTTGFTASAADENPKAELKVTGQLNDQPLFQLNLNNKENNRYAIIIKDDLGEVLFEERVSGVNIIRKFQMNADELTGVNVNIEIINLANSTSSVFSIKNNKTVTTEIVSK